MSPLNHYDTLEVSPKASPEVIRAAFKSLMQRHHPDRHPGDAAAAQKAALVASAYEVLSDPVKRSEYDALLQVRQSGAASVAPVSASRSSRAAFRPPARRRAFSWGHVLLLLVAIVVGVWGAKTFKPGVQPQSELNAIRMEMTAPSTSEASRRQLFARKAALAEAHPELKDAMARELAFDRAKRTWILVSLPSPFTLRVKQGAGEELFTVTLATVRVVAGSFDTASVLSHWERHRESFLAQLPEALLKDSLDNKDPATLARHVRQAVARVLMAGMGDAPLQDYPSTYHESPGRYGVVDVLLSSGVGSEGPGFQ